MSKFELWPYHLCDVRDGASNYEINKLKSEMKEDEMLIIYKHDVTTHYYAVPKHLKNKIGTELLEFFYKDNFDYTDDDLRSFKSDYPDLFQEIN